MNIELLHNICKDATRKAFNEFKRQVEVELFPFNNSLKENLQKQMLEQIRMQVTKEYMSKNNLSIQQLKVLDEVINQYSNIALKTSDNYSKKINPSI
ncbi:hypothetical protein [Oceanihabitans sediminis]|uniref:Uncharacterized protein n=1 Tax=Oceanihabitans sediminis TaxID=1812012 RepID=A0A368P593_9FLAO|nr:hypothetical protein [Oceanihabitans sediminis]MDX1278382.1 hypothetical protein [Oceanihabitans sediminis]RBP34320.1 hypothetical protein DFR65_101208 [Oceanihabitans sediminis]RCU58002.1 hypothetical protein DU428_01030 [Oceanihabitans sediminis]